MVKNIENQVVKVSSFLAVDISNIKLPLIAVYQNPSDYPSKCVARLFDGENPLPIIVLKSYVEELRLDIQSAYPYMIPFQRVNEDAKSLVETWV